ncbi:hypothetical protein [Dialister pneumosintes]|nr:hypothetical protein [Dialister pneumosintes]
MKDQKVYGIVYLTPAWRDVAPLKDCIVTRVIIDNREKNDWKCENQRKKY